MSDLAELLMKGELSLPYVILADAAYKGRGWHLFLPVSVSVPVPVPARSVARVQRVVERLDCAWDGTVCALRPRSSMSIAMPHADGSRGVIGTR